MTGDPKPDNLAELEAAFRSGDATRIRAERKKYERQLIAAGSRTPMNSCPYPLECGWHHGECLFCGERQT